MSPNWEELEYWFHWPPNLFALISTVFQRTGAYKFCLLDPIDKNDLDWNRNNWQVQVEDDHLIWLKFTDDIILGNTKSKFHEIQNTELLITHFNNLLDYWKVTDINQLRNICELKDEDEDIRKFVISLITCFAIADSSCRSLGLVGQTTKKENKINKVFHTVANLLLNNTGSLSTIPKFHGTVLPKMRTPQSGLSLRSLSHHLTFHVTEVEIMWRTFPWLNNDKQSLNVLAVPYPSQIDQTNFEIVEDNYHSVRYFKGKIKENEIEENILINSLVNEVKNGIENHNEIDIIVLPEMALNETTYNRLLNTFAKYSTEDKGFIQLPIIIAGVIKQTEKNTERENRFEPFHNEARIATFFGGKWYYIRQRKHHRWHLERNQILQYKLEGYFPTDRNWFELSTISQRKLTVLTPNSWLALSSLICEDLAQQEPIGDVIRGIGPTLLMALLSDGPQLTHRWSARYASVLADDPGTAVLSLTSKGMAHRSQRIEAFGASDNNNHTDDKADIVIGLWKDMIKGWKELYLPLNKQALLFTISATFKEEFTLDGRTDHTNASVFKMNTISPIPILLDSKENYIEENQYSLGGWDDIRDLSSLLFTIDSLIDLLSIYNDDDVNQTEIDKSVEIILNLLNGDFNEAMPVKTVFDQIKYNILASWKHPEKMGIEGVDVTKESLSDMVDCVKELKSFIDVIKKIEIKNSLFKFYEKLIKKFRFRF